MSAIPLRYLPRKLTKKDKQKYYTELVKSKKLYKKGQYYTRKKVKSFTSKKSNWVAKAKKMYNIDSLKPSFELSKKTGCSEDALNKIVKKGMGAYYSSGSRPNQTTESWGIARLASSLCGGKASFVDYDILKNGCDSKSKPLQLANKLIKTNKKLRKTPKLLI